MTKLGSAAAQALKQQIGPISAEKGYAIGISGNSADGFAIAIRSQGAQGTKEELLAALADKGIVIDAGNLDFQITDQAVAQKPWAAK